MLFHYETVEFINFILPLRATLRICKRSSELSSFPTPIPPPRPESFGIITDTGEQSQVI